MKNILYDRKLGQQTSYRMKINKSEQIEHEGEKCERCRHRWKWM